MLFINLKKSEIPIIGARAGGGGNGGPRGTVALTQKKKKKNERFRAKN